MQEHYLLQYWDNGHHQWGIYSTKAEALRAIQLAVDTEGMTPWDFNLVAILTFTVNYTDAGGNRQTYRSVR